MAEIHQAVADVKKAFSDYQAVVATYNQTVTDEMARVEKELQDIRASGGGADAQDLEDLANSISTAKDNIAQANTTVANFELPAVVAPNDNPAQPPAAQAAQVDPGTAN